MEDGEITIKEKTPMSPKVRNLWIMSFAMVMIFIIFALVCGFNPVTWHGVTKFFFILFELLGLIGWIAIALGLNKETLQDIFD